MATAAVTSTPAYTLTLTEDELQAVYALVGAVASTNDSVTGDIYDAIAELLSPTAFTQSTYTVGDRQGGFIGTLYLTKT